jgi:hypothetical protein
MAGTGEYWDIDTCFVSIFLAFTPPNSCPYLTDYRINKDKYRRDIQRVYDVFPSVAKRITSLLLFGGIRALMELLRTAHPISDQGIRDRAKLVHWAIEEDQAPRWIHNIWYEVRQVSTQVRMTIANAGFIPTHQGHKPASPLYFAIEAVEAVLVRNWARIVYDNTGKIIMAWLHDGLAWAFPAIPAARHHEFFRQAVDFTCQQHGLRRFSMTISQENILQLAEEALKEIPTAHRIGQRHPLHHAMPSSVATNRMGMQDVADMGIGFQASSTEQRKNIKKRGTLLVPPGGLPRAHKR